MIRCGGIDLQRAAALGDDAGNIPYEDALFVRGLVLGVGVLDVEFNGQGLDVFGADAPGVAGFGEGAF